MLSLFCFEYDDNPRPYPAWCQVHGVLHKYLWNGPWHYLGCWINDLTHSWGSNPHPEADNTQVSISSPVLSSRILYQEVYSMFSSENVRASTLYLTGPKLNLWTTPSPTGFSSNVLHLREWDPVRLNQGCLVLDTSLLFIPASPVHQQNLSFTSPKFSGL